MRTLSRVSAAFLLLDGRDKTPVLGATILVDGVRQKTVSKGDGHYVFINLPPTEHEYEISALNYHPVRRVLDASPELLPEIVPMQYAPDSPRLRSIPHYRVRFCRGGRPLDGETVTVTLQTLVGSLRVIEKAEKGAWHLSLGGGYAPAVLYQTFEAGPAGELMTTVFDRAAGTYELRRPLDCALREGTLLHPRWQLETDRNGVAVLPFIGFFMQRDELELLFAWQDKKVSVTAAPPGGTCLMNIDFQEE